MILFENKVIRTCANPKIVRHSNWNNHDTFSMQPKLSRASKSLLGCIVSERTISPKLPFDELFDKWYNLWARRSGDLQSRSLPASATAVGKFIDIRPRCSGNLKHRGRVRQFCRVMCVRSSVVLVHNPRYVPHYRMHMKLAPEEDTAAREECKSASTVLVLFLESRRGAGWMVSQHESI